MPRANSSPAARGRRTTHLPGSRGAFARSLGEETLRKGRTRWKTPRWPSLTPGRSAASYYYDEVSYGNLSIDPTTESHGTANDGVVSWLTLNQNHPNTAGNTGTGNRLLTRDAVNAANPHVNFAQYDTNNDGFISSQELPVTVIAAGQEASFGASGKSVWGHNWSLFGTEQSSVDGKTFGDDAHG